MSKIITMSNISEQELFQRIKAGDKAALEQVIMANQPMVRSVVNKLTSQFELTGAISREDLVQEGMLALMRAVENFTPNGDAKFSTYAHVCIKGRIFKALREETCQATGSIPASVFHLNHKINRCRKALEDAGRKATPEAVAEELQLPVDVVVDALMYCESARRVCDIGGNSPTSDGQHVILPTKYANSAEREFFASSNVDFLDGIETLSDNEKAALRYRFCQGMTLSEVGEQLGMTPKGAQLLILRALGKALAAMCPDPNLAA